MPNYENIIGDLSKNNYIKLNPIEYIDTLIKWDKRQNPKNKQTNLIKTVNGFKKIKPLSVYLVRVNKRKLIKLGIGIDRLNELYQLLNIQLLHTYDDVNTFDLIIKLPNNINQLPREYINKHVKQAKEDYNYKLIYSDLLNKAELVTAEVEGRNLKGLLSLDFLDTNRVTSNNMHVIASVFGIEASQKFFIEDLNRILSSYGLHPQHVLTIAYLFFSKGVPTGAMHNSVNKPYGPIDKASVSKATDVLKSSALQGLTHQIKGIASGIVFGLAPKIGTGYFDIGFEYDKETTLFNRDIYKSFKMDRQKIDQQQKQIVVMDSQQADDNINEALDYYGQKSMSKTLKSTSLTGRKLTRQQPQEEPTTTASSTTTKQPMTVKSKYDI
jgi:hypothetical protein